MRTIGVRMLTRLFEVVDMNSKLLQTFFSVTASALMASSFSNPAQAKPVCDADSDVGTRLNLPVYRWHDDTQTTNGYIVAVHGLTFYASAFDSLAKNLSSKGFEFYAADMRGFGRWKEDSAKFGGDDQIHFSQSEADIKDVCQTIRTAHPGAKVYVLGESLGANLALWMASNHPDMVDGVIVSAPCFEADMHPSPRWAIDVVRGLSHPNKPLNLTPYITPYLSNDRALTRACLKDQKICRRLSPVELFKAGRTNKEALVKLDQIPESMPVLMIAGKLDKVMHTSAIPKALPKFGSKQISVHILPDRGHLLLEHQDVDVKITGIVNGWLDQSLAAASTNGTVIASAKSPATATAMPSAATSPATSAATATTLAPVPATTSAATNELASSSY